ncbi:MAG: amidohydrolase family protein [Nitrososphaerales archaeon]
MTIIDAYTHFVPKQYLDMLAKVSDEQVRSEVSVFLSACARHPHLSDLDRRIEHLDKYGIDYEVSAPQHTLDPNKFGQLDDESQIELCRVSNNEMARAMKESKGRIYTLGTVPLSSLEESGIEEMRRAIRDLGLKGFEVLSNVRGKPIDRFEAFWAEAERLDAAVYIHPADAVSNTSRTYEGEFDLMHVFGWPFETTLIFSRLLFSGVMSRHPRLRVLAHHLGGTIPFLEGRISESYSNKMAAYPDDILLAKEQVDQALGGIRGRRAIDFYKVFYYDTAIGGSLSAIRTGCEVFGVERIVFGTDYPFGSDGGTRRLATYPEAILRLNLPKEDLEKIFVDNATKLLAI